MVLFVDSYESHYSYPLGQSVFLHTYVRVYLHVVGCLLLWEAAVLITAVYVYIYVRFSHLLLAVSLCRVDEAKAPLHGVSLANNSFRLTNRRLFIVFPCDHEAILTYTTTSTNC